MVIGAYIFPTLIVAVVVIGFVKGVKVFDCFLLGAKEALPTVVGILPALMGLMLGVSALRESGAIDYFVAALSPIARAVGMPAEVLPLTVLSPVSGSGSLSVFEDILHRFGPDSPEGRVASVIMGSTETTFYAVTVYYASAGVKKTRCTVPAALTADIVSFVCSALSVKWLM